jgi:hypothetical protein
VDEPASNELHDRSIAASTNDDLVIIVMNDDVDNTKRNKNKK